LEAQVFYLQIKEQAQRHIQLALQVHTPCLINLTPQIIENINNMVEFS